MMNQLNTTPIAAAGATIITCYPAIRRLPAAQDVVGDYAQRLFFVYFLEDYRQSVSYTGRGKMFGAAGGSPRTMNKTAVNVMPTA